MTSSHELSPAAEVFADYLAAREDGEAPPFEELLRQHPALADELRRLDAGWRRSEGLFEPPAVPSLADRLGGGEPGIPGVPSSAGGESRYQVLREVARGGMGRILEVWDRDLRRTSAMKVLAPGAGGSAPTQRALGRFLEEAQVTGQLEHPGIVPVHDVGLDADGRVYFTMPLVRGRDLREVYRLVREQREGWSVTRALGVLLRVCEALSAAHARGVLHRDLKPSNVMVGEYGETYVLDWGLARVLGREDAPAPARGPGSSRILSSRREEVDRTPSSNLATLEGDVVGTPAYMSPEQARGELERLGPATDVYAVGAMLYELLAGGPVFEELGDHASPAALLTRVAAGPPTPLFQRDRRVPPELVAITERAMAREPEDRYAGVEALGEDLRAYLEGRVVAAHRTGAVAELRKWIGRNRGVAAALLVAVAAAFAGLLAVQVEERRGREVAERERSAVRREHENVLRLSAFQELEDLRREADGLWPLHPDLAPRLRDWLRRARELVAGLEPDPSGEDRGHRAQLAELRARAAPPTPEQREAGREVGDFADETDRWWYAQLVELVAEIEAFADPETGLLAGVAPPFDWGVARRLAFVESVRARSIEGPEARAAWDEARRAIAAAEPYGGLELAPQLGLLPLGPDPRSGLWEFAHLASGTVPARGADGELVLDGESSVVLVLIPGGTYRIGAQPDDPTAPHYDPAALPQEGPVVDVRLDPFFLGKFETTQGEWVRFTGANPSYYRIGGVYENEITARNPVEGVSLDDVLRVLGRMGLEPPTEAQWEAAARAGADTPFWTGADERSLVGAVNLCDAFAAAAGAPWDDPIPWLDDGHVVHAPAGAFPPNAFGLHEVLGNIHEWCRDDYFPERAPRDGDGITPGESRPERVSRGGSYSSPVLPARLSFRNYDRPGQRSPVLGVRAARAVDP